jgi:UDP-GlcNAc3NAcA epimerase
MSQIQGLGLKLNPNIDVREPTNFGKFLRLEAESSMILTDSGTSQEESFLLRKPCLVLRDATERPETMLSRGGNATLWEGDQNFVENNISTINGLFSQDFTNMDTSIYGNGDASKNIVNAINRYMNRNYSDYGTRRYVVKRWEL